MQKPPDPGVVLTPGHLSSFVGMVPALAPYAAAWEADVLRLGRWRNAAKNLMVACGYDPALVAAAEEPEQATLRGV